MNRNPSSVVDIILLLILLGVLLACGDGNQDSIDPSSPDDLSTPEIFETSADIRDGDGNETDSFLPGETLSVSIHLTNVSEEPQTWQFSSGQFFDIEVFDKNEQRVWAWSHDKFFTQDLPVITFSPFETKTYVGEWDQSLKGGAQAESGAYFVYVCSKGCYGQRKGPYPIMIANDNSEHFQNENYPDGTIEEFIWETKGGGDILFSIIRSVNGFQIVVSRYDFQTVAETFILSTADLEVYGIVEDIFNNVIDLYDYTFTPDGETGTWTTITLLFSEDQELTIGNIQAWRDTLSVLYDFVEENTEQLLAGKGFGCGSNPESVQNDQQYNNPELDLSTNHLYDYDEDNTSWPYPYNEAGDATVEGMNSFFSFIQDHFKESNLSGCEADQVYMVLEKHKEYFDGSIYTCQLKLYGETGNGK